MIKQIRKCISNISLQFMSINLKPLQLKKTVTKSSQSEAGWYGVSFAPYGSFYSNIYIVT